MLMTMFVVGLNAPSLPLLPLFTCAQQATGSQHPKTSAGVSVITRLIFIYFPFAFVDQCPVAAVAYISPPPRGMFKDTVAVLDACVPVLL
jgi:hypothetical protein